MLFNSKCQHRMTVIPFIFLLTATCLVSQSPAGPPFTVRLTFEEGTVDQPQREAIRLKLQTDADAQLGANKLTFTLSQEDMSDRIVTFKNTTNDSLFGESDGPGFTDSTVYVKQFRDADNFTEKLLVDFENNVGGTVITENGLVNVLAETALHEVYHTFNMVHTQNKNDITCDGNSMPEKPEDNLKHRRNDHRSLPNNAKTRILRHMDDGGNARLAATGKKDIVACYNSDIVHSFPVDDTGYVDALLTASGPMSNDFYFGWLGKDDTTTGIFVMDWMPGWGEQLDTMFSGCQIQFALLGLEGTPFEDSIFSLGDFGEYSFDRPVYNSSMDRIVFQRMTLSFDVDQDGIDDVLYVLDTSDLEGGMGVGFIPEPAAFLLLSLGWLHLRLVRKHE